MRWHSSTIGVERRAGEDRLQRRADLRLPRRAQRVVLQLRETACGRLPSAAAPRPGWPSQHCHSARTSRSSASACCTRSSSSSALGDLAGVVALAQRQRALREEGLQRVDQRQLVAQAELDVDALDALGVLAHARQRDHHVLVDLEGVGVLG